MDESDFESKTIEKLREHISALDDRFQEITARAKKLQETGREQLTGDELKDILKLVSSAITDANEIIDDHAANILRASDKLISQVADTNRSATEVLDSIIFYEHTRTKFSSYR